MKPMELYRVTNTCIIFRRGYKLVKIHVADYYARLSLIKTQTIPSNYHWFGEDIQCRFAG